MRLTSNPCSLTPDWSPGDEKGVLVGDELVERQLVGRLVARSNQLPGFWLTREYPEVGLALRLSHDELGTSLYPTLVEREAEARRAAEERIRELEAELRRRS